MLIQKFHAGVTPKINAIKLSKNTIKRKTKQAIKQKQRENIGIVEKLQATAT